MRVLLGFILIGLVGCSSNIKPYIEPEKEPIPPALLESCELPKRYSSVLIEEVILTSVDNLENHLECYYKHEALVKVLK